MDRRPALVAVIAVALALAGCFAPPVATDAGGTDATRPSTTAAPGSTPSGDGGSTIRVVGGSLPFDPRPVFDRVRSLLGSDVAPPDRVRVEPGGPPAGNGSLPPFWTVMGVTAESGVEDERLERGRTTALGTVVVYPGANDSTDLRTVLAHEFVHYVQFAERRDVAVRGRVDPLTTEGRFLWRATLEGAAVVVTDAYLDRRGLDASNAALYRRIRSTVRSGSAAQYRNSIYLYGNRYVDGRIDDPSAVDRVYERPPRTSEAVIHGYPPGAEPPRSLSVRTTGGAWRPQGTDRLGEAFLRVALRNGVDGDRADRAAAGWGNDSLRVFRPADGGDPAYAWAIRWDDPANATEFATTFEAYLDARGNRSTAGWRVDGRTLDLRGTGETTTVVLVGPRSFVRNATVEGTDASVLIDLPDRTSAVNRSNRSVPPEDRSRSRRLSSPSLPSPALAPPLSSPVLPGRRTRLTGPTVVGTIRPV